MKNHNREKLIYIQGDIGYVRKNINYMMKNKNFLEEQGMNREEILKLFSVFLKSCEDKIEQIIDNE